MVGFYYETFIISLNGIDVFFHFSIDAPFFSVLRISESCFQSSIYVFINPFKLHCFGQGDINIYVLDLTYIFLIGFLLPQQANDLVFISYSFSLVVTPPILGMLHWLFTTLVSS